MGKKRAASSSSTATAAVEEEEQGSGPGASVRAGLDKDELTIFDYLVKQNRPYSANDVFNNLHATVGRTAVTRVLAGLAERGLIHSKTYGKQIVYVCRQDSPGDGADVAQRGEELARLDQQIGEYQQSLADQAAVNGRLQQQLSALNASLTDGQLRERIAAIEGELADKQARLAAVCQTGKVAPIDPAERQRVLQEAERLEKLLRGRRRMCMEMIGGILEGADLGRKTPRQFLEEIGGEPE